MRKALIALTASLLASSALAAPKMVISAWLPQLLNADIPNYPNEAAAMAAEHFTVIWGLQGKAGGNTWWPDSFGADKGQMAIIKANGLYIISESTKPNDFTSNTSVASILALAKAEGAEGNVYGYSTEDEPACTAYGNKPIPWSGMPNAAAWFKTQDPTRIYLAGETSWQVAGRYITPTCFSQAVAAVQSYGASAMDHYALVSIIDNQYMTRSDGIKPNDSEWIQHINVQGQIRTARPDEPVWGYVELGDALASGSQNTFPGGVTAGSNVLVNAHFGHNTWNGNQLIMKFSQPWVGLTVSGPGISLGTKIVSIQDDSHAIMSQPAAPTTCTPAEISLILTAGSKAVTLAGGCADLTNAAYAFRPIIGQGIPPGTSMGKATDSTHSTMNKPALLTGTFPAISAAQSMTVTVTGGARKYGGGTSDCVAAYNLCVVNGNEYRPTDEQVNGLVWMSLISGAVGINYFEDDTWAWSFGLGAGKDPAALKVAANVTWVNQTLLSYSSIIESKTIGQCSTENLVDHTGTMTFDPTCTNGILTVSLNDPTVPVVALLKQYGAGTYLFAQSLRRTPAGIPVDFTVALPVGIASHQAKVVYDSNTHYDRIHTSIGTVIPLDASGMFKDTLGAYGKDYQIKIYQIQ